MSAPIEPRSRRVNVTRRRAELMGQRQMQWNRHQHSRHSEPNLDQGQNTYRERGSVCRALPPRRAHRRQGQRRQRRRVSGRSVQQVLGGVALS